MLDKQFFFKVAPKIRDAYRDHIFKNARDVNGHKFKKYSDAYGKRKRAGKLKRQSMEFAGSRAPVASGDLLRDFGLTGTTSRSFSIGWNTFGARVEHLENNKRFLSTDDKPLPDKVAKKLDNEVNKYIKKKLGGNTKKTIKI